MCFLPAKFPTDSLASLLAHLPLSPTQFTSMLQYMNQVGVRDGVTGSPDQSVGGAPLSVHLNKMQELRDVVLEVS